MTYESVASSVVLTHRVCSFYRFSCLEHRAYIYITNNETEIYKIKPKPVTVSYVQMIISDSMSIVTEKSRSKTCNDRNCVASGLQNFAQRTCALQFQPPCEINRTPLTISSYKYMPDVPEDAHFTMICQLGHSPAKINPKYME